MRALRLFALTALALTAAGAIYVTQPWVVAIQSKPATVSPQRLQAHVKHLSVDLFPRSADQPRQLAAAAAFIEEHFKLSGGEVRRQTYRADKRVVSNIIVRFGPASGKLLVIGAHYDSHGDEATAHNRGISPDSHTPGADDNASGVAGLIELAYLLGKQAPTQPVELVAYTLEEPPHFREETMGSRQHAAALITSQQPVRLMLSLEMIGYFSDQPNSQAYPLPLMQTYYPTTGNFLALVGNLKHASLMRRIKAVMLGASSLPVYSINAPAFIPGIDFSDHQSYWAHNIPAIMVTDTAFMRNTAYHTAQDTWQRLDYRRMAQVVQAVFAVSQVGPD
jgi:Zn-dependent M28 family amino/carboxypeptidase